MDPVVVASDLSAHASEALQFACRLRPAPIRVVHIVNLDCHEAYGLSLAATRRGLDDGSAMPPILSALERVTPADVPVAARHAADGPGAIAAYCAEVGADLLVVGTHGRTGLRRLALGSVAEALLRRAPCDVLVIPLDWERPWSERPTRRVLCAVPMSPVAESIAARAAAIADRVGASAPVLLHVADVQPADRLRERADGPAVLEAAERTRSDLERDHGAIVTAAGDVAQAIVRQADRRTADLVVVGTHKRRGAARALGSVAARVVRTASRPVLVVHPSPHTP